MPTPSEQKALLFLGAVALLGGGVRLLGDGPPAVQADEAERTGLAAQIVAAEGAAAAARAERTGRRTRGPKGKRTQRVPGGEGAAAAGQSPDAGPGATRRPLATPAAELPLVDVDRATPDELDALPGIGPSLARRIVADRDARGPFGSLEALDAVSGVGPTLINRLRPHVTFSGSPRPTSGTGTGGNVRVTGRIVGLIGGRP